MTRWPFTSVFSQVFILLFASVATTLALGLGVLALSPPPPPATVTIADFVDAYRTGSHEDIAMSSRTAAPTYWAKESSQAETLIGASLANGVGVEPSEIRVAMAAPSLYGLLPAPVSEGRGQMTIIDVPNSVQIEPVGQAFDINRYLRNEAVRVPPFVAAIRDSDGNYRELKPRERIPTAWQLRLLTIFGLSILIMAPLALWNARRWTEPIRLLAQRVDRFDGEKSGSTVTRKNDADELKALERAFEALYERIRTQINERMQLLMAVAHDLRTPLTSLRIRSEDVPDAMRSGFNRDVARLDQMIEGILAFAKARSSEPDHGVVDLAEIVEEVAAEARARGEDVTCKLGPTWIRGNSLDLSRAVDNLLRNAIRYGERAKIALKTVKGYAILSIQDSGPGVPDDLIPRLTEPFFRAEGSRSIHTGGIGLGLATVKELASTHGGELRLANTRGGFLAELRFPSFDHLANAVKDPRTDKGVAKDR